MVSRMVECPRTTAVKRMSIIPIQVPNTIDGHLARPLISQTNPFIKGMYTRALHLTSSTCNREHNCHRPSSYPKKCVMTFSIATKSLTSLTRHRIRVPKHISKVNNLFSCIFLCAILFQTFQMKSTTIIHCTFLIRIRSISNCRFRLLPTGLPIIIPASSTVCEGFTVFRYFFLFSSSSTLTLLQNRIPTTIIKVHNRRGFVEKTTALQCCSAARSFHHKKFQRSM